MKIDRLLKTTLFSTTFTLAIAFSQTASAQDANANSSATGKKKITAITALNTATAVKINEIRRKM
jgi:hypothetical protein